MKNKFPDTELPTEPHDVAQMFYDYVGAQCTNATFGDLTRMFLTLAATIASEFDQCREMKDEIIAESNKFFATVLNSILDEGDDGNLNCN